MTATPDTNANTGTVSERIPCFGGPMDGQDAPLGSLGFFDVVYPVEKSDRLYYYGGVQVDGDVNRGRYTLERFVYREWSVRYPTEEEMQEWERQMAEWHKPTYELSFLKQLAREMFGGKGDPPPMPRRKCVVRDRTASAFVWEVSANGRTLRPGWEARLRFDDPPWRLDHEREAMHGKVATA